MSEPVADIELAMRLFQALRDDSRDGAGVTRDAYGPGEQRAHDRIAVEGRRLGLEQHVDYAGNLALTLPGRDRTRPRIVLGSHLDSVRQGGDYDGTVGVLAGLACIAGYRRAERVPARDITLLVTRAEEAGAWFPVSFPGSRAALGTLPAEALNVRRADTGRTLEDHMLDSGFDPAAVRAGMAWLGPETVEVFLELHIEQGPVLDARKIPVGIVTGIPGSRRHREGQIVGEANHSGATPRTFRRDAAIATAELAYRLDQAWERMLGDGHELVCTFCVLGTDGDAAFSRVAGSARFELDTRSLCRDSLNQLHATLLDLAREIEVLRGVRIVLGPETGSREQPLHPGLQDELERAASELGLATCRMPSGGGHDVAAFAQAGVPAALLFVRNQNGSHTPAEAMRTEDFVAATAVAMRWLTGRDVPRP